MKINKAKLLVGTLAIAAVAATVGSISGTVAWFQYSTRVTTAYQGAAAHCSENLEIRIRKGTEAQNPWKRDLVASDIAAWLSADEDDGGAERANGVALHPVTSQALAANKVAADLYKNPIYQYTAPSAWGTATAEDYILLPLELRVLDVNGNATESFLQKKIYVSDITMQARADHTDYTKNDHIDLTKALRVGVSAGTNASALTEYTTFSSDGVDVNVYGKLDLNGDGKVDKGEGYEFSDPAPADLTYGVESTVAKSTAMTKVAADAEPTVVGVANDAVPYDIKGKPIGTTDPANADAALKTLKVDLKIYLEGWTSLAFNEANTELYQGAKANLATIESEGTKTAGFVYKATDTGWYYRYSTSRGWQLIHTGSIWDATQGVGAEFNLGIRFSAEAHNATGE